MNNRHQSMDNYYNSRKVCVVLEGDSRTDLFSSLIPYKGVPSMLIAVQSAQEGSLGQSAADDSMRSRVAVFATWLGHWKPEYEAMDNNELMLQASKPGSHQLYKNCVNAM